VIIKKTPKSKTKKKAKISFEGKKKSKPSKIIIESSPDTSGGEGSVTSSIEIKAKRGIMKSKSKGRSSSPNESIKSLEMDDRKVSLGKHLTMDLEKLKYAQLAATDECKSVEIKVIPKEITAQTGGTQFDQPQAYFPGLTAPLGPVPGFAGPISGFAPAPAYPMAPSPADSVLTITGEASISGISDESGGRRRKGKGKRKNQPTPLVPILLVFQKRLHHLLHQLLPIYPVHLLLVLQPQ